MHYGADYNPEQWPEELWPDDIARMREAGVTMVSLGIFAWARIQPREGEFDFGWLDRAIDLLHEGGIAVDLATATASPPPWASAAYPELLPRDEDGTIFWPGSRQAYAPSSPVYRRLAGELVTAIATRYAQHPAVVMWHVNNEYGCHLHADYSDAARDAFRRWLADRYADVDELNRAWGTNFWSQRYGSFDEVLPPRKAPYSRNPGQVLDFHRFTSDMLLECYLMERDLIRAAGATQPITTNFMGAFKPADYAKWAEHVDVVSDDCYPDPNDPDAFRTAAFQRDLIRSLKPGVPWLLMEQSTNALNWRPSNAPKAPGQMAALSAQAIGRGADGILFFQWRQSKAGAEKFHSAMLPHAGTDTRTWRETVALGEALAALPELPAGARDARVAIVFDWENWWAVEASDHPQNRLDHLAVVQRWHRAFHRRNVQVDLVPAARAGEGYDLVVAPLAYLLREADASALTSFVESGGHLVAGPFTDVVDDFDRFRDGGFTTQLRAVLGVDVEDFGALVAPDAPAAEPGERAAPFAGAFEGVGTLLAEELRVTDAAVEASFVAGRLAGRPALTLRASGRGTARYVATVPDEAGTQSLVDHVLEATGVEPVAAGMPDRVEAIRRGGDVLTVVNHGDAPVDLALRGTDLVTGEHVDGVALEPFGWVILRTSAEEAAAPAGA
ncbi:beta-galactosidase [Agromyces sp. CFH 90414]|uniref:Beta-galactosidase n=1 Tax=Agromyces agglutinans TaxID=2662258 RepID=A0A6I2FA25_9MICO|nr:beta-galactosidase [Agromyces agglutinans]MRG61181.1 beta-galactosidase [Agromyces agglutinans]